MIIPDPAGLPGALTAGTAGIYALEAGTELIIGCGCWLRREDFTSRVITAVDGNDQGTMLASIDWEAAIAALDAGELPCSNGERRVLRLAASIAAGTPVSLSDAPDRHRRAQLDPGHPGRRPRRRADLADQRHDDRPRRPAHRPRRVPAQQP